MSECYNLIPHDKEAKLLPESSNRWHGILFQDCDTSHAKFPYHVALVIMLKMKKFVMHTMMIDTGSGIEILFQSSTDQMGLADQVNRSDTDISGFNGSKEERVGKIILHITAGPAIIDAIFYVINAKSRYLLIMGRYRIHSYKGTVPKEHIQQYRDTSGCWPVAVIALVELLVFGCQKLWDFLTAVWWYDWGLVWLGRGGMVAILGSSCCHFGEGSLSRQWWQFWFRNYCHSYCYYGRRVRTVLTPFEHWVPDCWAADLAGIECLIFMFLWVVGVAQRSVVDRGFRCSFVTEFSCGADLKRSFGWVSYVGVAIGIRYFILVDVVVFLVLSVTDLEFRKSIRGAHFRWGSVWAVSPRLSFRAYRQASFIFLNN
ncbi:hypothetical protein GIB67_035631 [Kingdonia uniflora]|uniref:Peptidase A2 domain-containing protein n=1 Tax=Kingdonia uniflora TaxID=39325 RepID=A0A7J7LKQ1_9MAGN|nr:hypothetical protein GIB67_035631 [Kingdonia uniflora]